MDGHVDRPLIPNKYDLLLRPGYSGVKDVPAQHHIKHGEPWNDDYRILTALALVDGSGIGMLHHIQLIAVILHDPSI